MKLSIITINYNNREGLQKTLDSVFGQSCKDFEYIVIDGNSNDGSKELILQNTDQINYWVSESDKGIYNAMNKGIRAAQGEYILFLNSGDKLVEDVVAMIMQRLHTYDIIYGDWYQVFSENHIQRENFPDLITFNFLAFKYSLPHQSSFIKRDILLKHGLYDESLRMVSDWKFFLDAIFKFNCSYKHLDLPISYYDKNGFSSNTDNHDFQQKERCRVIDEGYSNFKYSEEEQNSVFTRLSHFENSRIIKTLRKMNILRF